MADFNETQNTFPVSVDYDESVEDVLRRGNFSFAHKNITSENFPTERTGKAQIVVALIHLGRPISYKETVELDRMSSRSVELRELLAFIEKYWDDLVGFPVIALGSALIHQSGRHLIPYICRIGSELNLNLLCAEHGFDKFSRFAVVRPPL